MQRAEASKGEIAINYFQDLFKSSNPTNFQDIFQGFLPRVTDEMNEMLIKDVSNEEVKEAIFFN